MRAKKKLGGQAQAAAKTKRERKGQKALADSQGVVDDGSARRSASVVPGEPSGASTIQYKDLQLQKGEPNVRRNARRDIAIEVWRGRDWVRIIEQAPRVELSKIGIDKWDREYARFDYPVGKAAWRLLHSNLGYPHTYSDKAKLILEIIMAHYLVDVEAGKVVARFENATSTERVAAGSKKYVAIDTAKVIPDADLAKVGKALLVEVDPRDKEASARAIMEVLNRTENTMPEKARKKSGAVRVKAELTDALKARIKTFLNTNKDLPYSKLMKAAAAAGFLSSHVKAVKVEVGHRTKTSWAAAAGKVKPKVKPKEKAVKKKPVAKKPKEKAVKKKAPVKKPAAKKVVKTAKPTATTQAAPAETKPAAPEVTK